MESSSSPPPSSSDPPPHASFSAATTTDPLLLLQQLQAGAWTSLCQHLQDRSDAVSNMELMTQAGFCRNCLAKWMVLEARRLAASDHNHWSPAQLSFLNQFDYDQAAQLVYGMHYADWKCRHQTKATPQQLERYEVSRSLWAQHDDELLKPKELSAADTDAANDIDARPAHAQSTYLAHTPVPHTSLASNVCCETIPPPLPTRVVETPDRTKSDVSVSSTSSSSLLHNRTYKTHEIRIGILVVSDRAFRQEYATGDLSGPAVEQAVKDVLLGAVVTGTQEKNTGAKPKLTIISKIVPDDVNAIVSQLREWCQLGEDGPTTTTACSIDCQDTTLQQPPHIVLTTGGTGWSPRDVTPEATRLVVQQECFGLMSVVLAECTRASQPWASLSRGTVGLCGQTMVANLPGQPAAAPQILPVLLPLMVHGLDL